MAVPILRGIASSCRAGVPASLALLVVATSCTRDVRLRQLGSSPPAPVVSIRCVSRSACRAWTRHGSGWETADSGQTWTELAGLSAKRIRQLEPGQRGYRYGLTDAELSIRQHDSNSRHAVPLPISGEAGMLISGIAGPDGHYWLRDPPERRSHCSGHRVWVGGRRKVVGGVFAA